MATKQLSPPPVCGLDRHSAVRLGPVGCCQEEIAMHMIALSQAALAMLRLHVEQDKIRIDDSNREAHRELARDELMEPIHTAA